MLFLLERQGRAGNHLLDNVQWIKSFQTLPEEVRFAQTTVESKDDRNGYARVLKLALDGGYVNDEEGHKGLTYFFEHPHVLSKSTDVVSKLAEIEMV